MPKRRDFLRTSAVAAGALVAGRYLSPADVLARRFLELEAPDIEKLLLQAVDAMKAAGAAFADARIGRYRRQNIGTREQQITGVSDTDTIGLGVRALVRGTWGFAGTRELTPDGVERAAREAIAIARANRLPGVPPVVLAPGENHGRKSWKSAYVTDPWDVPTRTDRSSRRRSFAATCRSP
jgi:TldD protein